DVGETQDAPGKVELSEIHYLTWWKRQRIHQLRPVLVSRKWDGDDVVHTTQLQERLLMHCVCPRIRYEMCTSILFKYVRNRLVPSMD
ncbi:hypothetical protein MAR_029064, partial [Mya arenaria]